MSRKHAPEPLDFREALMELEDILDAIEGTPEAERRDSLIEAVLEHEGALAGN